MRTKNVELNGTIRLSMSDHVKQLAKEQADLCFAGNVSAYIAHLILNDRKMTIACNENIQINGDSNRVTKKVKK